MDLAKLKRKVTCLFFLFVGITYLSCKKWIQVPPPIDTLTTVEIFSTDALAISAMSGVYSVLANGDRRSPALTTGFCTGLTTALGALSSDELNTTNGASDVQQYLHNTNRLSVVQPGLSSIVWNSAYKAIYGVNSIIEGITASEAPTLHENVKQQLIGEAKFVRAFCYFYLTNFFGDVPMALTVDFNQTQNLSRMPQQQVYQQIIKDLKEAQAGLPADYSAGMGERIIPNKWAATLLLARVYLYIGNYADASEQATAVINSTGLYNLESDLNNVFLSGSREAIWQLKQTNEYTTLKNATVEGFTFGRTANNLAAYGITPQLLSSFEAADRRKLAWVGSVTSATPTPVVTSYPYKYKIGSTNGVVNQPSPEYYMIFRLAEAYLIRAEAVAKVAAGGTVAALADLKIIRNRAGLPDLAGDLNQQQVITAVAQERRIEFFAEWGHRWFDLKRTGRAIDDLSTIPLKQPWAGDYQLLYPIPSGEIEKDPFLTQNPGY